MDGLAFQNMPLLSSVGLAAKRNYLDQVFGVQNWQECSNHVRDV